MTAPLAAKSGVAQTNQVTFKTITITGKTATDQTSIFPTRSSLGNLYIMVAYIRNANTILARPLKNTLRNTPS